MVYPETTFDPGTNATGWVGHDRSDLLDLGLLRPKKQDLYRVCPGASKYVHVEVPVIYPRGRQKARPASVLKLRGFAKELAALSKVAGGRDARICEYEPADWKHQIPDTILYNRIIEALRPHEIDLIEAKLKVVPDSLAHNVFDALGLWLHVSGRGF